MIELIALVLFLVVLASMLVAPGSARRGTAVAVAPMPKPVEGSVAQTA